MWLHVYYIYLDVFHVDVFKCFSYKCILRGLWDHPVISVCEYQSCLGWAAIDLDEALHSSEYSIRLNNASCSLCSCRIRLKAKQNNFLLWEKPFIYNGVDCSVDCYALPGRRHCFRILQTVALLSIVQQFLGEAVKGAGGQTDLKTKTEFELVGWGWSHGASIWCMMHFIKMYFVNCDTKQIYFGEREGRGLLSVYPPPPQAAPLPYELNWELTGFMEGADLPVHNR